MTLTAGKCQYRTSAPLPLSLSLPRPLMTMSSRPNNEIRLIPLNVMATESLVAKMWAIQLKSDRNSGDRTRSIPAPQQQTLSTRAVAAEDFAIVRVASCIRRGVGAVLIERCSRRLGLFEALCPGVSSDLNLEAD